LRPAGAWSELSHGGDAHGVRSSEWLPVGVIDSGSGVHNRVIRYCILNLHKIVSLKTTRELNNVRVLMPKGKTLIKESNFPKTYWKINKYVYYIVGSASG